MITIPLLNRIANMGASGNYARVVNRLITSKSLITGILLSALFMMANITPAVSYQIPLSKASRAPLSLFPSHWELLGPFPIGSRELGADPLSAYGGFESLPYDQSATFPSELADDGFVSWKTTETNIDGTVGPIDYANVRWEFNQLAFGWIALHHCTYFRGLFHVPSAGVYLVSMSDVTAFKIDNRPFVGNLYGYTHLTHSAVYLTEGTHTLYVQTVMDIRIFGGSSPPLARFSGQILYVPTSESDPADPDPDFPSSTATAATYGVIAYPHDTLLPEAMDGDLITPYGSVTIMNVNVSHPDDPPATAQSFFDRWVQVIDVTVTNAVDGSEIESRIPVLNSIKLAPGQPYPVPIELTLSDEAAPPKSVDIVLKLVRLDDTNEPFFVRVGEFPIVSRQWGSEAYKITFLDYDGVIQYAMAKPPKRPCSTSKRDRCPVLLALHGSGVEAVSTWWTNAYQQQEEAWVLYPTGRTAWGFDWHGPSHLNIQFALDTLSTLPGVPLHLEDGFRVDKNKLLYSGHSNGGQGAWWLVSHYPDQALAALPAAAYMKIQIYTPYYLRVGDAFADPLLRGILEASIAENDIDMYSANLAGINILARVGGSDDNVPPLHTRRMIRIVNEWARKPNVAHVSEVPAQGHWFDGVMSDPEMQSFLDSHLIPSHDANSSTTNEGVRVPDLPDAFTLSTLNPASTGTKGGIKIFQLEVPFRLGQIRVLRRGNRWILKTTNVRRFGFVDDARRVGVEGWTVDLTEFSGAPIVGPSYVKKDPAEDQWTISTDLLWLSKERHPNTYGPAIHVLSHPFLIVVPSNVADPAMAAAYQQVAQHLAVSWYTYGRGGTQIIRDIDVLDGLTARYNTIVLGGGRDNAWARRREGEGQSQLVRFLPSGGFQISNRKYEGPGVGILFVAPSPTKTRMGVFLAGTDPIGFLRAAWSMPFRTGLMVPDYMVVGDEYGDPSTGWTAGDGAPLGGAGTKGAGGVLAAGYWNNTWDFDSRCGYLK
ncbi:hypothetical protein BJ742DRAFT_794536 [Cladochytrium replicatum]|nr:hypothetical protein BJ742DRAFT_794536 [Cladochytrium replicatum]